MGTREEHERERIPHTTRNTTGIHPMSDCTRRCCIDARPSTAISSNTMIVYLVRHAESTSNAKMQELRDGSLWAGIEVLMAGRDSALSDSGQRHKDVAVVAPISAPLIAN